MDWLKKAANFLREDDYKRLAWIPAIGGGVSGAMLATHVLAIAMNNPAIDAILHNVSQSLNTSTQTLAFASVYGPVVAGTAAGLAGAALVATDNVRDWVRSKLPEGLLPAKEINRDREPSLSQELALAPAPERDYSTYRGRDLAERDDVTTVFDERSTGTMSR